MERYPIIFEAGKSVRVEGVIEQVLEGVASPVSEGEFLGLDNAGHPVTSRLNLARALKHFINIFGIDWEDNSGTNNGHFAPFAWEGETG